MRTLSILAAGLLATAGMAQAQTVVDFETYPVDFVASPSTTSGGFNFSYVPDDVTLGYVWDGTSPGSNGTNNLIFAFTPGSTLTITKVGGGSFKWISADLAVSWYSEVSPNSILINGTPLAIDSTPTTYTFNTTGTSFTISGLASDDGYWTGDNFTFGAVPEPASWAMMIAGFGLVGVAARRRREAVTA